MRMSWAARSTLVTVSLALAGAVLVACGSSQDSGTSVTTTTSTSTTTPSTTSTTGATTTTLPPSPSTSVRVYLVDREHVVSVHRDITNTKAVATAALRKLLEGPTADEQRRGFGTAVPSGTELRGVTVADGVATVDLSRRFESGGGSLSMLLRLAQVVFTATQFPSVQRIELRLDGTPVEALGGEGVMVDDYATRARFEQVLPAIFVDTPAAGATVANPLRVRGTANVFEAQFTLEVVNTGGRVVATRPVTATSGTGTRGSFEVTVDLPAGLRGDGKIVVFDYSAKDGSRTLAEETPVVFPG